MYFKYNASDKCFCRSNGARLLLSHVAKWESVCETDYIILSVCTRHAVTVLRKDGENALSYTKWKRKACNFFLCLEFTQQNTMRHLPSVSWPPHVFRAIGLLTGGKVSPLRLLKRQRLRYWVALSLTYYYMHQSLRGCRNSDYHYDWLLGYDAVCLSRNLPKCLYFRDSLNTNRMKWTCDGKVVCLYIRCDLPEIKLLDGLRWNLLLSAKK